MGEAIPEGKTLCAAIELPPASVCKPKFYSPRDTKIDRMVYQDFGGEAQSLNIPVFCYIMSWGERFSSSRVVR